MLRKTIEYTDYNGTKRKEDFYFNLTQAEIVDMNMSTVGGFEYMVEKIIATQDTPGLMTLFKNIIHKSYGEKSADGKRFMKSDELSIAFSQTEAYSNLVIELLTDTEAAAAFVNGITPGDNEKIAKPEIEVVSK